MTDRIVIALALFCSILLLGVLGMSAGTSARQAAEGQRFQNVTAQLRTRIETSLRVGLTLADNEDTQRLLEDTAAKTVELDSIEIDSEQGRVLFASDRVLRGQPVPPAWRDAMRANPSGWQAFSSGKHSAATALRDASGEIAGYLVWTHEDEADETALLLGPTFWIAVVIAAAALIAPVVVDRIAERRAQSSAFDQSLASVAATSEQLERVNREVHAIAGIEP